MVVKKDGTRERFERQKLIDGLLKACEKRPVSVAALEAVADRVEADAAGAAREGDRHGGHRRLRDGGAQAARQGRLRALRVGVPALPRHRRVHERAEGSARTRRNEPRLSPGVRRRSSVAVLAACRVPGGRAGPRLCRATPIARDGQLLVSFELADGFTADVRDAIQSGLPTTLHLRRRTAAGSTGLGSTAPIAVGRRVAATRAVRQPHAAVSDVAEPRRPGRGRASDRGRRTPSARWMTRFDRVPLVNDGVTRGQRRVLRARPRAHAPAQHVVLLALGPRAWSSGCAKFTFIP